MKSGKFVKSSVSGQKVPVASVTACPDPSGTQMVLYGPTLNSTVGNTLWRGRSWVICCQNGLRA